MFTNNKAILGRQVGDNLSCLPPPPPPPPPPFVLLSLLDCKTVGFFSKSVKKSVKRGVCVLRARNLRASHARSVSPQSRSLFSTSFQTFCLTALAYLNTQKYGPFCSLYLYKNLYLPLQIA